MSNTAKRVFHYNDVELDDINPNLGAKQIMEHYTALYPELVNATVNGPEIKEDSLHFTFVTKTGTFG